MSEKLITTPSCELTGLPLPIARTEPPRGAQFSNQDYHHHFHPAKHELLSDTAGLAVRYSRGQFMPRSMHDRYHTIFNGPKLPDNPSEQYRLSVLACAGVVPRQALNLGKKGDYSIVDLSHEEHRELSDSRSIYIENAWRVRDNHLRAQDNRLVRNSIGRFFANYALQQNIREVVSSHVIDEFLDIKTEVVRKKELGNLILVGALDVSIDDIAPIHSEATKEGLVSAANARQPREVIRSFFKKQVFPDYYGTVARNLSAQNT